MRWVTTSRLLFLGFFILYTAISVYLAFGLQIYHNDAVSRTANAFFTIFGRDPHMGAIGFVWQPLPSLAQIPLIILLKPLNLMMLSGPLITAVAGAFSVFTINKIGELLNGNKKSVLPIIIAILFGLNPMIALYSSIGTSEMIFIASLLLSSYYFLKWFYFLKQSHLLLASFFISISFWSRYESLPAFMAFCLLLVLKTLLDKFGTKKTESAFLQFILPFVYSVFFWILLNWMIMKDAFYFLNSPYSNSAFTSIFKNNALSLNHSYHSILNSLQYTGDRALYLAPIIVLLLASPIFLFKSKSFTKKLNDVLMFSFLTLPYIAILLFHAFQLYKGESFGWLRFYIYAIVAGSLIALYFASKHKVIAYISLALIIVGITTTAYAMNDQNLGKEENSFIEKIMDRTAVLDYSRTYEDQKTIALLADNLNGSVLLDTDKGFAVPLFSKNPGKFIITSDEDYAKVVKDFPSYVDWIIVPKPAADDRGQNIIYTYYPNIWDGKAPLVNLYRQIADWRIYKVNKSEDVAINHAPEIPKTEQVKTRCEYSVIRGDSLWRIAEKQLGNGKYYMQLVDYNADKITNPSLLHPADIIVVPCAENS